MCSPTPLDQRRPSCLRKESPENRDRLSAKIEETVYLPGLPSDQINELSNVAKNVFDIKQATVAQSGQALILRGDDDDNLQPRQHHLRHACSMAATTSCSTCKLYEVDSNFMRNVGTQLPTSIGMPSASPQSRADHRQPTTRRC